MTNGGAEKWQTPLRHIERACSYITDDGYIASYFSISRAEVQAIRLGMPKEQQRAREPKKSDEPITGTHAADTNARLGSEALLKRLENLFVNFARLHGLTYERAQMLQLQGYRT